ncbi:MAG: fibronectin type III domain-containing protein [Acidimicrobiia bacterium]|nr:fibronectin type III domain-containing protein [Acidimicrobiia bacterium]
MRFLTINSVTPHIGEVSIEWVVELELNPKSESVSEWLDYIRLQWRLENSAHYRRGDTANLTAHKSWTSTQIVYFHRMTNLIAGENYRVRVQAVDKQGTVQGSSDEVTVRADILKDWIEENVIEYYTRDVKPNEPHWLRESWYGVPLGAWADPEPSPYCSYDWNRTNPRIKLPRNCQMHHLTLLHEIAHHFTLHAQIYDEDREKDLARWSSWLYLSELGVPIEGQTHVGEVIAIVWAHYTAGTHSYFDTLHSTYTSSSHTKADTLAVLRSISMGEIPQWFLDTYTTGSTLATLDLNKLLTDLRKVGRNTYLRTYQGNELRLTRPSMQEYIEDLFLCVSPQGERVWQNPWADGECDVRRPSAFTLTAPSATQVDVGWRDPLHIQMPTIVDYLVQWKTGTDDYSSQAQQVISASSSDSIYSYSISGLTPGTQYTVRVSARNAAGDPTPFRDIEGRERWIESTVTTPAN